jgi:hypothetical protein
LTLTNHKPLITDLYMQWDSNKAIDYFIELYTSQNPDRYRKLEYSVTYSSQHDNELALQTIYAECVTHAAAKEELIQRLHQIRKFIPRVKKAYNSVEYQKDVIRIASELIQRIEKDELNFQSKIVIV